jgi:hypothetical protein
MRGRLACMVLGIGLMTAGCYGTAGSTAGVDTPMAGVETSPGAAPPSAVGPSPTIGYCGMDPKPVPCVDRAGDGEPAPTPVGPVHELAGTCASKESPDRCQAMALAAANLLGVGFDQIVAIDVVPNPSPEAIDFAHRTFLEVTLAGGNRQSVIISCPGIAAGYDPPCMSQPVVPIGYPLGPEGGYRDTPENATPFPELDPAAVAAATPLSIKSLDIPVTDPGHQTLVLGRATLPNGYLTAGSFAMADPWPSDVLFATGPRMVLTPTAGGPPLQNLYEHGWHAGTEEVEATLTFDVAWFKPGASFTITDIVVR